MIVVGVIAAVIGTAIVLVIDWFPAKADTAAGSIDRLYDVLLIFSVPIFVLVMAVAIYSVVRFRARPGDMGDGAPIHGNTRLEIFWVTVPFLIVTGLSVYGWIVLDEIEAKKPNTMVVNVTAQQFAWKFEYPGAGGKPITSGRLVLPLHQAVKLTLHSLDVIHSFWVPEFGQKSDAVPGVETTLVITPNRIGKYALMCTELCGLGHATMRGPVEVVKRADYEKFLASAGKAGGDEDSGEAIFTSAGCGGCHTFQPAGTDAQVGPDLDALEPPAGTSMEDFIRESITDPNAFIAPGYQGDVMPGTFDKTLSQEQLDALVQYLADGQKGSG
jgi:cytochrome c oxidase subunit II